jgi:hypothetical protein
MASLVRRSTRPYLRISMPEVPVVTLFSSRSPDLSASTRSESSRRCTNIRRMSGTSILALPSRLGVRSSVRCAFARVPVGSLIWLCGKRIIKAYMAEPFDLPAWLRRSTAASGVPHKVQDPAVIAHLGSLVNAARRSRSQMDRTASHATSRRPAAGDKSRPAPPAA